MEQHDMDSRELEDAAWERECEERLEELTGMSHAESLSLRTEEDWGPLRDPDEWGEEDG